MTTTDLPWSKGGSSDESNIRLLCSTCNRKKGKKFEGEFLVIDVSEHLSEPATESSVSFLTIVIDVGHELQRRFSRTLNGQDFANELAEGDLTAAESMAAEYFKDLTLFFSSAKPIELSTLQCKALKLRWGFSDGLITI